MSSISPPPREQAQLADQDPQTHDQAADLDQVAPVVPSARTRPDAHTQRYDRQLRLWASSGQASLESANVLLIGASHLGAQVLKNLILPGIGSFTVLDNQRVGRNDIGNNFFLEPECVGSHRATEVARFLAELNPSVKSSSRVANASQLLSSEPGFFTSFSLIVAVNQPPSVLKPLVDLAWDARNGAGIPLMDVRGAGMLGRVRVQIRESGIIETHPASTVDLRLTSPWPELSEYARSYDIDDKDAMAHSHIPFIVILLRKLDEWKQSHDGKLPTPSVDRKAFSDSINTLRDPKNVDTENFDEAIAALGQNLWRPISSARKVPAEIEALFQDEACKNVTRASTNFWLMVRALDCFVAAASTDKPSGGDGHLPLPGSLPDFKSVSATYVQVQRLYKSKAQKDLEGLKGHLAAVLADVGLPLDAIGDAEVESFAKHAGYLKLVRGRKLSPFDETPSAAAKDTLGMTFMDPVNPTTIQTQLAFQAVDAFYARHGRFPGSSIAFSDSIIGCVNTISSTSTSTSSVNGGSGSAPIHLSTTSTRTDSEPDKKRQRSNSPSCFAMSPRERQHSRSISSSSLRDTDGDSQMREDPNSPLVGGSNASPSQAEAEPDFEQDEAEALRGAQRVMKEWGISADDEDDEDKVDAVENAVKELVRSGHADIASTASLLGGVAAQEAIKLITKQYVPLEDTAIYDGIQQAIGTFKLPPEQA